MRFTGEGLGLGSFGLLPWIECFAYLNQEPVSVFRGSTGSSLNKVRTVFSCICNPENEPKLRGCQGSRKLGGKLFWSSTA